MRRNVLCRLLATLGVAALLVSACSSSGSTSTGSGGSGSGATASSSETPQAGGVATIGQLFALPGLDPTKLNAGNTGGIELASIYDTLMDYDATTGKYTPRTAESLTPNADYSEWTLKIKPGIKFTDGTDYDADAVKFVHDRELAVGTSLPVGWFKNNVQTYTVVDKLTVKYTLIKPWVDFPYVLTGLNGTIYSPTAQKLAGANFNTAPGDAGAGPFKVKSYKPGESLELERNPTYYGGHVPLDGLKYIFVGGAAQTYAAITAGQVDGAYVRDPVMAAQAQADGHDVISLASPAGSMAAMNAGATVTCKGGAPAICVGKADGDKVPSVTATANPAVRQAVANAIDPKVINQRVFEGKALPDSAPFANSAFDPGVKKPLYDADLAKKEVSAAKAAGWDGKIRVLTPNTPQDSAWGEAVSAMLTAAGMEVAVDSTQDQAAVINQVLVQKNFDIVTWSYGFVDEPPGTYLQMVASFTGLYGYNNPEMVAAVDSLRTADTPEKKKDSFNKISELWFRDNPSAVFTISKNGFIVGSKLHGVQRGAYAKVWFDKAWLSQ